MKEAPEIVTEEMLIYLDTLRESGATNMYGAYPHLQEEFGLSRKDSGVVLLYWMEIFSDRHKEV